MMKIVVFSMDREGVSVIQAEAGKGAPRVLKVERVMEISNVPRGIQADRYILNLSSDLLQMRLLELPFTDDEKLKEVVPFELRRYILKNLEEIVHESMILERRNGEESRTVLVSYMDRSFYHDIMRKLNEAGYDPESVTSVEILHAARREDVKGLIEGALRLDEEETVGTLSEEMKKGKVSLNFRRGPLPFTREYRDLRRARRTAGILLLVLLFTVFVNIVYRYVEAGRELNMLRGRMEALYNKAFPGAKDLRNPLYQMRARVRALREELGGITHLNAIGKLGDINSNWPEGVVAEEVRLEPRSVYIKGTSSGMGPLENLKESLPRLRIKDSSKAPDGKIVFTAVLEED